MNPLSILTSGFDSIIASAILDAYREIERNYVLRKWKPSELDAGHFVEAVRRALDLELTGQYKAFNKSLPPFNNNALSFYEQQTGDQSYRLLIPRTLKSIYNIRNKRGVAHISDVNPNEMDATLILYTCKWVLAELIRLKSGLPPDQTQAMLDKIVERQCPVIWKEGNITWVLSSQMKAREQVLVLLYDSSPRTDAELQGIIEYSNGTNFKKILKRLHAQKFIYYHSDGNCRLSPTGLPLAEKIIREHE
jgi:hypothetical protein